MTRKKGKGGDKRDDLLREEDAPLFPFDETPFQGSQNEEHLTDFDYDMDSNQELDIGESEDRMERRTLGEENDAGHEPSISEDEESVEEE